MQIVLEKLEGINLVIFTNFFIFFFFMDLKGNVIDQTCTRSRDYDDEDICSQSIKIINFIDLAGDQKYLKTTVFGLSGYSPHYAVLVVR